MVQKTYNVSVIAPTSGFTAQPGYSVSAPSGFANGASITITGSGFGSMDGDVLQYLRGDERTNGQPAHGATATIGSSVDTFLIGLGDDPTGLHIRYSTANPRPGRTSSIRRVHDGTDGTYRAGGFGIQGLSKTKLYVRWWGYNNLGAFSSGTANYKQFYAFGTSSDLPQAMLFMPAGNSSWGFYQNIGDGSVSYNVRSNINTVGWTATNTDNEWGLWECYFELGTVGGYDGTCRVWRNNVKGIENTAWLSRNVNGVYKQWYLGYMDLNMAGAVFDFSDVYVADTVARVEITDSATWGVSAAKEIQPARNANWSNSSIQATVNIGAHGSLTGKYLYVVKSDGTTINIGSFV